MPSQRRGGVGPGRAGRHDLVDAVRDGDPDAFAGLSAGSTGQCRAADRRHLPPPRFS
jgi:hypothetical protein